MQIKQVDWSETFLVICLRVVADLEEATVQKVFLICIAAGLLSGPALASDLPVKAPIYKAPIAAPLYNWGGFYVGANFGGGWSNGSLNIPGNNLYGGLTEFVGGVQAGYNFQAGHFLFGVEGEFDGAGFGHPVFPAPTLAFVDQHWIGTVAGRVGLVDDRWLVFAKLGGGWVNSSATLNLPGAAWNGTSTNTGWLAGRWHRIRLQVALDRQTRIRLSWAIELAFSHRPLGRFEPRPTNGQSWHQL